MGVNIRPLNDRIVVKRREEEEKSKGGILLPDSAKEKPLAADVVAVGPGRYLENGQRKELDIKVGDQVLFGKYSGTDVSVGGEDLVIIKESDVMGIVEGKSSKKKK